MFHCLYCAAMCQILQGKLLDLPAKCTLFSVSFIVTLITMINCRHTIDVEHYYLFNLLPCSSTLRDLYINTIRVHQFAWF